MIRTLVLWLLAFLPHRIILREGTAYLTRFYLLGGPRTGKGGKKRRRGMLPFNLFLHCFHASDVPPAHNHPWKWSRSLILKGCYDEVRVQKVECDCWAGNEHTVVSELYRRYRPGQVNRIDADTWHYVTLLTPEVWTLFLAGPVVQAWRFLDD